MKLFIIPIIIALLVQAIKLILDIIQKKYSWNRAMGYGGMPSSHSALVMSLATVAYLIDGAGIIFAITAILALIVIRDAIGLRGYLTMHAKVINRLIKDLPDEKEYKYPVLEETIAHTFIEITVGGLLGIFLTLLFYFMV